MRLKSVIEKEIPVTKEFLKFQGMSLRETLIFRLHKTRN